MPGKNKNDAKTSFPRWIQHQLWSHLPQRQTFDNSCVVSWQEGSVSLVNLMTTFGSIMDLFSSRLTSTEAKQDVRTWKKTDTVHECPQIWLVLTHWPAVCCCQVPLLCRWTRGRWRRPRCRCCARVRIARKPILDLILHKDYEFLGLIFWFPTLTISFRHSDF